jgi:cyanate permease
VGATPSAAVAVPIANALGSWRYPLLVFSAVSVALVALWLVLTRAERGYSRAGVPRPRSLPW